MARLVKIVRGGDLQQNNLVSSQYFLPDSIFQLTSKYTWQQIFIGESKSEVFKLQHSRDENLYLKTAPRKVAHLTHEKQKLEWLAGKLPVPQVRAFAFDESHDYLLISEIDGVAASDDSFIKNSQKVVEQLACGLHMIHSLSIEDCPFDMRLERKIELARRNVEQNLVDENDFDEQRLGRTAADLFQELTETKPKTEDLVFTHGDYCLPNIILKDFKLAGFIDWGGAGIADYYQDVALLARSVETNFGAEWLPILFENLKLEPDHQKIDFYQLLDEFF